MGARKGRFPFHLIYQSAGTLKIVGNLLEARFERLPEKRRGERAPRRKGTNRYWTRQSRMRLYRRVVELSKALSEGHSYAICLTYQQRTPEESKKDLNRLNMRLKRKLKGQKWCCIWKMEFQRRGTVHYHLILSTERPFTGIIEWISKAWAEITKDPQLAITGTCVQRIETSTLEYCTLYIIGHMQAFAKEYQTIAPEEVQWTGRWWGIWNRPKQMMVEITITWEQFHAIKRQLKKLRRYISTRARAYYWTHCENETVYRIITWALETYTRFRHAKAAKFPYRYANPP